MSLLRSELIKGSAMAMVVTFRVPVDTCAILVPGYGTPALDDRAIKAAIKQLISTALRNGTQPVTMDIPPSMQTVRINISLKDVEAGQIRDVSKSLGVPESVVCQRLIIGLAQSSPATLADTIPPGCELLEDAWTKTLKTARVSQAQVYLNLQDALSDGHIALVEAATGVGKTLAMILAAEDRLRTVPDSRVVISVPTLAVMRQFVASHSELVAAGFQIHPVETLFGRREFVSLDVLREIMDNPKYIDHKQAIAAWISLNGEPMPDSPFEKPWLAATLRRIAPGFPVEACSIPDVPNETDPGYLAYAQQFDHRDRDAQEILLCTHAMLSISTKHRHWGARRSETYRDMRNQEVALMKSIKATEDPSDKAKLRSTLQERENARLLYGAEISQDMGKLPPFRYLIIDEAHLLESAMSSANAAYLSIHSLVKKASDCHKAGLGITAKKLEAVKAAATRLQSIASYAKDDSTALNEDSKASVLAREALIELLDAITLGRSKKKGLTTAQQLLIRQLEYGQAILRTALLSHGPSIRSSVKFSPVREFPQIHVGANRVDGLLASLWASVKAAACVSATLYVAKKDGFSSNYQRRILSIPDERAKDYAPVVPLWMFEAVKGVALPSYSEPVQPPSRGEKLSSTEFAQREEKWLTDVSKHVAEIRSTAAGGTLVLMTSYESIKKLSKIMQLAGHDNLVIASVDASLAEQSIAFLKLAQGGCKPLWFATGAAWTGLDIGGHEPLRDLLKQESLPASEDNVLTDLVIPRLPFGINKSLTHEHRILSDPRMPWELLDMLFRMKQGLGRLIRREGLPNNRLIFFLDSRIYNSNMTFVHEQIELMFRGYKRLVYPERTGEFPDPTKP